MELDLLPFHPNFKWIWNQNPLLLRPPWKGAICQIILVSSMEVSSDSYRKHWVIVWPSQIGVREFLSPPNIISLPKKLPESAKFRWLLQRSRQSWNLTFFCGKKYPGCIYEMQARHQLMRVFLAYIYIEKQWGLLCKKRYHQKNGKTYCIHRQEIYCMYIILMPALDTGTPTFSMLGTDIPPTNLFFSHSFPFRSHLDRHSSARCDTDG